MYKLIKEERTNNKTGFSVVKVYVASKNKNRAIVTYVAKGTNLDETRARALNRCQEWIETRGVKNVKAQTKT